MRFAFIRQHRAEFSVRRMCCVLEVSTSGYYAWLVRPESERSRGDRLLKSKMAGEFKESRETYGSRRLGRSVGCGRTRSRRLMREGGLVAKKTRQFRVCTTDSSHSLPVAENLVAQNFTATGPDQIWAGDITQIRTREGWLYLAVLLDLFSRKVVGWATSSSLESSFCHRALERAVASRRVGPGLIHHTDRGTQAVCRSATLRPLCKNPGFRNTLSSGDRSTLALAFFITGAELDPDLSEKILVYDDPFSSQDRSRRTYTQQQICRLGGIACQTILLSHEPRFLRSIWDATEKSRTKALQFSRVGEKNTTLNAWKIEDDTRGDYFQKRETLRSFLHDGEGAPRHVAQTLRPVLEEYLRFNWPDSFSPNEWLGSFIAKIESAEAEDPLHVLQEELDELCNINDYSKRYHHGDNPAAETEPIDDGELSSYVRRTLKQTSAC